jgi:hypothetical protein
MAVITRVTAAPDPSLPSDAPLGHVRNEPRLVNRKSIFYTCAMSTSLSEDQDPPLVPGQPEFREYRSQGVSNNQRVGPYSAVAGVWTVP